MIATIAVVKRVMAEIKENAVKMFQGEITLEKKVGWLIGAVLLLTGIAIGLINAPLTHGINISIASNNGNGSGCNNGNGGRTGDADEETEKLCKPDISGTEKEKNLRKVRKKLENKKKKIRR
ncbi:MAG: hypothetical protein NC314_11875 [Roseburia sp.]|nr:hypothetical protein [Roseburia sp.]MCM1243530.1 hypothetical protein [Roseburia sp.]